MHHTLAYSRRGDAGARCESSCRSFFFVLICIASPFKFIIKIYKILRFTIHFRKVAHPPLHIGERNSLALSLVENGQIRLPADVHLPERARVYVVVPGQEVSSPSSPVYLGSPRLANPAQAIAFKKEVIQEAPAIEGSGQDASL